MLKVYSRGEAAKHLSISVQWLEVLKNRVAFEKGLIISNQRGRWIALSNEAVEEIASYMKNNAKDRRWKNYQA